MLDCNRFNASVSLILMTSIHGSFPRLCITARTFPMQVSAIQQCNGPAEFQFEYLNQRVSSMYMTVWQRVLNVSR